MCKAVRLDDRKVDDGCKASKVNAGKREGDRERKDRGLRCCGVVQMPLFQVPQFALVSIWPYRDRGQRCGATHMHAQVHSASSCSSLLENARGLMPEIGEHETGGTTEYREPHKKVHASAVPSFSA